MVAVIAVAQLAYNATTSGNVLGVQAQLTPTSLLEATNRARAGEHEQPLRLNTKLMTAAQLKAHDMFAKQYWDHDAPDGTTPWYWFGEAGYAYAEAGENLAKNFSSPDSALSAWMASPVHRANILKADYQDVGFAVADGTLDGQPTSIVVALYGTPESSLTEGVAGASTSAPPVNELSSPVARFNLGMHLLTPAALGSIIVLLLAVILALVAHMYRKKLPPELRRSWYRHHGIYKAIGLASLGVIIVFIYSGSGQI